MMKSLRKLATGIFILACVFMAVLFVASRNVPVPKGKHIDSFIIKNANIVDVRSGDVKKGHSFAVKDGKITSITPADAPLIGTELGSTHVIDAQGSYIIPGLWDMHAHATVRTAEYTMGPALVANGVFYIREMIGDCVFEKCLFNRPIEETRAFQRDLAQGNILGPQIMSIGSYDVGGPRALPEETVLLEEHSFFAPTTDKEGRKLAAYMSERGVDFVKPYDSMPREAYFSMLDEAKKLGLTFEGHIPKSVTLREAIDAGQRTVEHARYPILGCSTQSDVLHKDYAAYTENPDAPSVSMGRRYADLLATIDDTVCGDLLKYWADSDTYYVPTHLTREAEAIVHNRPFLSDPRAQYVSQLFMDEAWEGEASSYGRAFTKDPVLQQAYMDFHLKGIELTGRAHRAGVKVMVGTDAGDMLVYPGFGVHDEMQNLVSAGISPLDSLRAATLVPAEFYGLQDTHGSLDVGKVADFVVVSANPLEAIKNTQKIVSLYYNGRFYTSEAIDEVLAEVKNNASGLGLYLTTGWTLITHIMPGLLF